MTEQNDHDMITRIDTTVASLARTMDTLLREISSLNSRLIALEIKDRGDSERLGSVIDNVKVSNNNSTRIAEAHARLDNMQDDIKDLKEKSNRNDAINAILATGSGIIGFIFGNK